MIVIPSILRIFILFCCHFRLNNIGDIAVHSLKDLPTIIDERLTVAAVPAL